MKLQRTHEGEENFYYKHICPGCNEEHLIPSWGNWQFNDDFEKPTFSPSLKHTFRRGDTGQEKICHYFIKEGMIQYCGDSMHDFAGKTVELPEYE